MMAFEKYFDHQPDTVPAKTHPPSSSTIRGPPESPKQALNNLLFSIFSCFYDFSATGLHGLIICSIFVTHPVLPPPKQRDASLSPPRDWNIFCFENKINHKRWAAKAILLSYWTMSYQVAGKSWQNRKLKLLRRKFSTFRHYFFYYNCLRHWKNIFPPVAHQALRRWDHSHLLPVKVIIQSYIVQ